MGEPPPPAVRQCTLRPLTSIQRVGAPSSGSEAMAQMVVDLISEMPALTVPVARLPEFCQLRLNHLYEDVPWEQVPRCCTRSGIRSGETATGRSPTPSATGEG
jgi:hypothetical protein